MREWLLKWLYYTAEDWNFDLFSSFKYIVLVSFYIMSTCNDGQLLYCLSSLYCKFKTYMDKSFYRKKFALKLYFRHSTSKMMNSETFFLTYCRLNIHKYLNLYGWLQLFDRNFKVMLYNQYICKFLVCNSITMNNFLPLATT